MEQALRRPIAVVDVSQRDYDEFYEEEPKRGHRTFSLPGGCIIG